MVGNDLNSEKSTALIARDLLGGGSNSFSSSTSKLVVDSQELDLVGNLTTIPTCEKQNK